MRGFPSARIANRERQSARAVSVDRALREQAEADQAAAAAEAAAAPEPVLIDAHKPKARRTRATDRADAPARPSVRGRPTTPDEQPLSHAPAATRLTEPQLRTTLARPSIDTTCPQTAQAAQATQATQATHRPSRRRTETWARDPSRPRPSRLLAELNAALADELASAE